jgi:hypothetical protein
MSREVGSFSHEQLQYLVFIGLSVVVAVLVAVLYTRDSLAFRPYLGGINPLLAIALTILLGVVLLTLLLSRGWFEIYSRENLRGLLVSVGLAGLMAVVMILVDLRIVFPADINKLFPESLLFYPSIAYVVEVLFHVLPLSVLLIVLTLLSRSLSYERIIWPCILLVSLIEPTYQTILGLSRPVPALTTGYVGLHIFVINLLQLLIFRRYDFISMYSFRFVYYLIWHIVWGYVRLRLLF